MNPNWTAQNWPQSANVQTGMSMRPNVNANWSAPYGPRRGAGAKMRNPYPGAGVVAVAAATSSTASAATNQPMTIAANVTSSSSPTGSSSDSNYVVDVSVADGSVGADVNIVADIRRGSTPPPIGNAANADGVIRRPSNSASTSPTSRDPESAPPRRCAPITMHKHVVASVSSAADEFVSASSSPTSTNSAVTPHALAARLESEERIRLAIRRRVRSARRRHRESAVDRYGCHHVAITDLDDAERR